MRRICRLDEIDEPGAKGLIVHGAIQQHALIVVRWRGQVAVYVNSCPHTGVNLEWMPDQFFDVDGQYLQCATHGALFRPDNGYCVGGPCAGQSLDRVRSHIEGEFVLADIP
ncbi:MAG: Rieske 2Fe-2S domain-containing protein [Pseudomonadota bacterium]|nr:MAG: Rieske 2Fe-2S domain-containing protein [Pseudomonadota bacterium]